MSCCYKGPKRTMTCHGTCKDYADEMAENEKKLLERRKEREAREALLTPALYRMTRDALNKKK